MRSGLGEILQIAGGWSGAGYTLRTIARTSLAREVTYSLLSFLMPYLVSMA